MKMAYRISFYKAILVIIDQSHSEFHNLFRYNQIFYSGLFSALANSIFYLNLSLKVVQICKNRGQIKNGTKDIKIREDWMC